MDRRTLLQTGAAFGCVSSVGAASAADSLQSTPDMRKAALTLAGPTLGAKLGGSNQNAVKFIVLKTNIGGETLIGGFGILTGPDDLPPTAADTTGLLLLRPDGKDLPPHGSENRFAGKGVVVFITSVADRIWEMATVNGVVSVRAFTADKLGDWQPFQSDPAKYRN